jgi:NAD+ kinase
MGHLGFLTATPLEELDAAIGRFIAGDYSEDRRRGVEVRVERADPAAEPVPDSYGLNDAVIHKSGYARLIALRVWVDEEEIGQYSADGIIISTATGSTAYSLSAGGPILVPGLDALVATPICPHTLAVRPVVVPSSAIIRVEVLSREAEMVLTVDGRAGGRLQTGDRVITHSAEHPVRLIRFPGQAFFSVLRHKLKWGDVRPPDASSS